MMMVRYKLLNIKINMNGKIMRLGFVTKQNCISWQLDPLNIAPLLIDIGHLSPTAHRSSLTRFPALDRSFIRSLQDDSLAL